MKQVSSSLFVVILSIFSSESLYAAENGFFVSQGVGLSPIYIEEIVDGETLAAGSSGMVIHTGTKIGLVFADEYAVYFMSEQSWYGSATGSMVATGVTGLATTYFVPNFFDVNLMVGIGLGSKYAMGDGLAMGSGIVVGFGRPLTNRISLDVTYSAIRLSSLVYNESLGDSENISSANVSLSINF